MDIQSRDFFRLGGALVFSLSAHGMLLAWRGGDLPPLPFASVEGVQVSFRSLPDGEKMKGVLPQVSSETSKPKRVRHAEAKSIHSSDSATIHTTRESSGALRTITNSDPGGREAQNSEPVRVQGGEDGVAAATVLGSTPAAVVNALPDYRLTLARAAKGFRRYPSLARERGWEGVVRVQLSWRAGISGISGVTVSVEESCGHGILDEQAQEMLRRAVVQAPLPPELQGRSFSMVLPVEFSLKQP